MGKEDQYLQWKRTATVGCTFARYLARSPQEFGQRLEVVESSAAVDIATQIDMLMSQFVADSNVSGATFIMPNATQLDTLVGVALALEQKPSWRVTRAALEDSPGGPVVAFGISREVQLADGKIVPSEALVLGPFSEFPATRRAPVTALEIFVGTPPPMDIKTGNPTTKANLANMEIPGLPQAGRKSMWDSSISGRLASLNGIDDSRAKARVAFVISMDLARSLGCSP